MNYVVTDEQLRAIADAIREKGGTSAQLLFPDGFVTAVGAIETGGGGEEDIIGKMGNGEEVSYISDSITKMREYMFYKTKLKRIYCPNVTTIGGNAFNACTIGNKTELLEIDKIFPSLEFINPNSFTGLLNNIVSIGGNVSTVSSSAFNNANITELHLGESIQTISPYAFGGIGETSLCIDLPNLDANGLQSYSFGYNRKLQNLKIKNARKLQKKSFVGGTVLTSVFISSNVQIIDSQNSGISPFYDCKKLTDIYTDATEKPSGWGDYFNYFSSSGFATVHYGVTEAEFDAIVSG